MFHRGMHDYGDDGRDLKIEGYIELAFNWMVGTMFSTKLPDINRISFVDIGCDYGFAMSCAQDYGFKEVYGLEPNPGTSPENFRHLREKICSHTIEDCALDQFGDSPRVYFLNHVLEHFEAPVTTIRKLYSDPLFAGIFIATPDAEDGDDDFIYRDSHLSIFTQQWHERIGSKLMPASRLVSLQSPTLRENKKELWAFYARE